jgi:hypothetical protein
VKVLLHSELACIYYSRRKLRLDPFIIASVMRCGRGNHDVQANADCQCKSLNDIPALFKIEIYLFLYSRLEHPPSTYTWHTQALNRFVSLPSQLLDSSKMSLHGTDIVKKASAKNAGSAARAKHLDDLEKIRSAVKDSRPAQELSKSLERPKQICKQEPEETRGSNARRR